MLLVDVLPVLKIGEGDLGLFQGLLNVAFFQQHLMTPPGASANACVPSHRVPVRRGASGVQAAAAGLPAACRAACSSCRRSCEGNVWSFETLCKAAGKMENAGFEPDSASELLPSDPQQKPQSRVVTTPDAHTPSIPLPSENHPIGIDSTLRSAPGVPEDPALATVIAAWPSLSLEDRQRIVAIVEGRDAP